MKTRTLVPGLILAGVLVLVGLRVSMAPSRSLAPAPPKPQPTEVVPEPEPEPEVPPVPFPEDVDPQFSPERAQEIAVGLEAALGLPVTVDCAEWPCLLLFSVGSFDIPFTRRVSETYTEVSDDTPGHIVARTVSRCMVYGVGVGGTEDDQPRARIRIDAYGEGGVCGPLPSPREPATVVPAP